MVDRFTCGLEDVPHQHLFAQRRPDESLEPAVEGSGKRGKWFGSIGGGKLSLTSSDRYRQPQFSNQACLRLRTNLSLTKVN